MEEWHDVLDIKPAIGRNVICYCPKWNSLGYVVAIWDGKKFTYYEEPNDCFDECVEMWSLFYEAD